MRWALPYWASIFAKKERSVVGGVAGQHLVGERKAVRRHHQRDDHLRAIGALIAAVAVPALVGLVLLRIGFKIGARQVVEQDIEARAEQILPALSQVREQRPLVLEELVQAAIEGILLDQRKILAEQIPHGALLEPQPMQPPFASRIDQPVAHQGLQDMAPARAFARIGQASRKEAVELQLLIEVAGEPAGSPLPRPMQLHRREPHTHTMTLGVAGYGPIGRKQGQLPGLSGLLIKGFDHSAPSFMLAVIDLAKIKNLPLHHLAAGAALALDNAPITVLLAVLEASVRAQIHDESSLHQCNSLKRYLVSTTADFQKINLEKTRFYTRLILENRPFPTPVEKVGLRARRAWRASVD